MRAFRYDSGNPHGILWGKQRAHQVNKMKNYKLTIQYDGSRYSGWQVQGNTGNTIQGKLQSVLGQLDGAPV